MARAMWRRDWFTRRFWSSRLSLVPGWREVALGGRIFAHLLPIAVHSDPLCAKRILQIACLTRLHSAISTMATAEPPAKQQKLDKDQAKQVSQKDAQLTFGIIPARPARRLLIACPATTARRSSSRCLSACAMRS